MSEPTVTVEELEALITRINQNSEANEDLWYKGFAESILSQLKKKYTLSSSQMRTLEKIKDGYSDQALLKKQQWKDNWSDVHRQQALKVYHYYRANPPYFNDIVIKILSDEDGFFLDQKQWSKFMGNKYSLKILGNYEEALKFTVGDTVQIRATNKIDVANCSNEPGSYPRASIRREYINKVGFILQTDAKPVTRAAKGSRVYKLLITGETAPIYAHESDLKKVKKNVKKN